MISRVRFLFVELVSADNTRLLGAKLLSEWNGIELLGGLKRAIHFFNFHSPTEIQKLAIPIALQGRDVIGVAETVCSLVPGHSNC